MSNTDKSDTSTELLLFAVLVGCKPKGRNIEQHDVMFGVAHSLNDLTANIKDFWHSAFISEVATKINKISSFIETDILKGLIKQSLTMQDKAHIDAWTAIKYVDGYRVQIRSKNEAGPASNVKLFFINLGGYLDGEFEEFHKKMFIVAESPSQAIARAKQHDFFKQYTPENLGTAGKAHIDDQYRIDFEADDIICLSETIADEYKIVLEKTDEAIENPSQIGYIPLQY